MNIALILLGGWVGFCVVTIVLLWVRYWRGRHQPPILVYDRRCNGRPHSVHDLEHDYAASLAASHERRGL